MTRLLSALTTLTLVFAALPASAQEIYVRSAYLTDSNGYNYGARFWLDSTVNAVTCVVPRVVERTNVNGDVAGPFLLQPNEKGVNIGSFISADRSKPWNVDVGAKWKEGDC